LIILERSNVEDPVAKIFKLGRLSKITFNLMPMSSILALRQSPANHNFQIG